MEFIKSKWRTITFALLIICYLLFIVVMDKRVDLLYVAGVIYLLVTTLLFLGTIVGIPGIILHSFLKKEKAALPFYKGAVSLGSGNTNILAAYGLILLRDYQPGKALDLFQKAKAGSNHFLYHKTMDANISLCLWKMGKTEEASKTYEDLFYYPDLERIEDFSPENLEEGMNKNHNFYPQDFTTMAYLMFINGETEKCRYFSTISIEKQMITHRLMITSDNSPTTKGILTKPSGISKKGLS